MALDLEDHGLVVADIDDSRAFPRTLQDAFARDRELAEDRLRVLVAAVLGPHDREKAGFRIVRCPSEDLFHHREFFIGQPHIPV